MIIYHSTNRYPPTIECLHHVWNGRLVVRDWLLVKCRTASTCGSCAAVAVGFCSIATCVPIGHGLRGKPSGLGNYRDRRAHRIATPWPAPIKIRSAQPPAVSIGARLRVFGYVTRPAVNPGSGPAALDCGPQCISPYRNWLLTNSSGAPVHTINLDSPGEITATSTVQYVRDHGSRLLPPITQRTHPRSPRLSLILNRPTPKVNWLLSTQL